MILKTRVIRWSLKNNQNQQIISSEIFCCHLTMDNNGDLYVSDFVKNEVRRWKIGDKNGTIVAGGNGKGNNLNQLNTQADKNLEKRVFTLQKIYF